MRRALFGLLVVWLGHRIRPSLELRPYSVRVETEPAELARELRQRLSDGGDVLTEDEHSLIARFSGAAGAYSWSTLEHVRFTPGQVDFEHLAGSFRSAHEQFTLQPQDGATRFTHTGHFTMPGGLLGWVLGLLFARRLFEEHVAEHMNAAVARHASEDSSNASSRSTNGT